MSPNPSSSPLVKRLPETGTIASDPERALRAGSPGWDSSVPFARIDPIVDVARLRQLAFFPLGSLRRHRGIALAIVAAVTAFTIAAVVFLPRTYMVQSRILARRNVVMPALGNPRRTVPGESDAPTRLASEAVMGRENLLKIIESAGLMNDWEKVLSPTGLLRNRVREMLGKTRSEGEKLEGMIGLLEQYMWVVTQEGNEGTVSIGVSWRDPEGALRIVTAAQNNFIQRRFDSEVSTISESITILERYVAQAKTDIEESMAGTQPAGRRIVAPPGLFPRTTGVNRERGDQIVGLQNDLRTKEATVTELERARGERTFRLESTLSDLKSRFGAAHPEVATAEQNLAIVRADSSALVLARSATRTLIAQLSALGGSRTLSPFGTEDGGPTRESIERWMATRADSLESPEITYSRSRLKIGISRYEDLLDRLEGARIELETARAAFKYRYSVMMPPQMPNQATTPNVPRLLVIGMVMAVALAVFAACAIDLLSGRIVESWQVERSLGLPVLGEV